VEDPKDTPFWKKLAAGGAAGGLGSAIANPTDLLKARMQVGDTLGVLYVLHVLHVLHVLCVLRFEWRVDSRLGVV